MIEGENSTPNLAVLEYLQTVQTAVALDSKATILSGAGRCLGLVIDAGPYRVGFQSDPYGPSSDGFTISVDWRKEGFCVSESTTDFGIARMMLDAIVDGMNDGWKIRDHRELFGK